MFSVREHGDQHSRTMDKRQVQRVRGFSVILLLYWASLLGVTLVKWWYTSERLRQWQRNESLPESGIISLTVLRTSTE